jgi:hypothetical protein
MIDQTMIINHQLCNKAGVLRNYKKDIVLIFALEVNKVTLNNFTNCTSKVCYFWVSIPEFVESLNISAENNNQIDISMLVDKVINFLRLRNSKDHSEFSLAVVS